MPVPTLLEYRRSALLRSAQREDRFDAWEYFEDGDYPGSPDTKIEVENLVAAISGSYEAVGVDTALARNRRYLEGIQPDRLAAARGSELTRLLAFADLQFLVEESREALDRAALAAPRADDPLFEELPSLYAELSRDGLLEIRPDYIPDMWLGAETAFCLGEEAFFPHPYLAAKRELLGVLVDLACTEDCQVALALHPFRRARLDQLHPLLLEDYWFGLQTTRENVDALDAHEQSRPTFHAVGERSTVQELFNPMLGTWFDWARRGDNQQDPVKRLYIREVRPPLSRHGEPLAAVVNNELHSERDTAQRRFTHVDGKVCRYPAETYGPSAKTPTAPTGPASHSRKLWRVDGRLSDEQWCELVGLHFRGNELIGEHFADAFPSMPKLASDVDAESAVAGR